MSNQISSIGFYTPTKDEAFLKSIFSEHMDQNDSVSLTWALNVTQKAYDNGMVAQYIERNKTENIIDDKDYVDFWASVTIIFGYIVSLVRKIGLENPTQEIFFRYLEQKNLFNCPTQSLIDLGYIAENYLNEIRKRGTRQVYLRKGVDGVDGEIRRIVCYSFSLKDEFNFILHEPFKAGWVIDAISPLYLGFEFLQMANKGYEDQIENISNYPQTGTPTIILDAGENVIQLDSGDGISGSNIAFQIPFHATLPYEISFLVKGAGTISFGVNGYNNLDVQVQFKNVSNGANSSVFFASYVAPISTEFYLVRGIIFPYNFINFPSQLFATNLGIGNNLQSLRTHRTLIPQINCTAGQVLIKNLKINPAFLEWNTSFIHPANFVSIAATNRNGKLSPFDIFEGIRYYMLPYDSVLALKLLENLDEAEVVNQVDLTEVLLNQENEGVISGTNLLLYTV